MTENSPRAGSTAPTNGAEALSVELLQSVVDVARAIFNAEASSVFLLDHASGELIFEAVSGQGQGFLVGRRFPANAGIAGWVVASGEPLVVDNLRDNTVFDRELAESTEFVPDSLMAAPLIHGDRVLGVLEVLDPVPQSRSSLNELDLLALFARQAAAALRVVMERREHVGASAEPALVSELDPQTRASALQLVENLQQLLATQAS